MLDLGTERTIEWTTVFADHTDPYTFWYLPNHVSLDSQTIEGVEKPVFQMIEYTGGEGDPKGAFVNFQVCLQLPAVVEKKIKSVIASVFRAWIKECTEKGKLDEEKGPPSPSNIRLHVAPWGGGTVECVSFDKSSLRVEPAEGDEESASGKPDAKTASFSFTQSIQGSVTPSLDAKNTAIFGLHLTKEGAELMRATLENPSDTMPIGIIYQLKYVGMTPSYRAHISADMSQVYKHLSARVSGQKKLIKVGITAGLEELKRNDVIKIEIEDFLPGQNKELEAKVMSILEEKIINEWMKPVLTPGELRGMVKDPDSLDTTIGSNTANTGGNPEEMRPVLRHPPLVGDPPDEAEEDDPPPPYPVEEDDDPPPPYPEDEDDDPPPPYPEDEETPPPSPDDEPAKPDEPEPGKKLPDNSSSELEKIKDLIPTVAGGAVISFELKAIKQTELRTLTFDLNKREAQQRSFCPQQFLTNILASQMTVWKDKEKKTNEYLQRVVFDSAFFDTFPIKVYGPDEELYPTASMKAATVTLRYPRSRKEDGDGTEVFSFNKGSSTSATWQPHLEGQTYDYSVEYTFHDNFTSGWLSEGSRASYSYQFSQVKGRTVNVSLSSLQLIRCRVVPGEDNWEDGFTSAKVEMRYLPGGKPSPSGPVPQVTLSVRKNSEPQLYRLRIDSKDPVSFEYRVIHKGALRDLVGPWLAANDPGELTISGPALMPLHFRLGSLKPSAVVEVSLSMRAIGYDWQEKKALKGTELTKAIKAGEWVFSCPIPQGLDEFKCSWAAEIKWKKGGPSTKLAEQSEGWSFDVDVAEPEE
jgi:hypothetical protein